MIEEVLKKKFVGDITIVLKNMSNKEEILEKKVQKLPFIINKLSIVGHSPADPIKNRPAAKSCNARR